MFLYPIRFIKLASKFDFEHWKCLVFCRQFFVSVMDTACVSDGQMHIFFMKAVTGNPKLNLGWKTLENTGNWNLYVHQFMKVVVFGWFCRNIFSTSSFFGVVDMNSITDAAIINRFLKLLFCNKSWFLDITQSKYIITRQQCLKSPEMLILCEAGQNDLQKCPSLTKFLPNCFVCLWWETH